MFLMFVNLVNCVICVNHDFDMLDTCVSLIIVAVLAISLILLFGGILATLVIRIEFIIFVILVSPVSAAL